MDDDTQRPHLHPRPQMMHPLLYLKRYVLPVSLSVVVGSRKKDTVVQYTLFFHSTYPLLSGRTVCPCCCCRCCSCCRCCCAYAIKKLLPSSDVHPSSYLVSVSSSSSPKFNIYSLVFYPQHQRMCLLLPAYHHRQHN